NWAAWEQIAKFASDHGVDTRYFKGLNDGDLIPDSVCCQMADILEEHFDKLSPAMQRLYKNTASIWRNSGGFRQY
ncbi:MAG: hypothetical protein AAGF10_07915, partial [Verrucomicrobiota bacterium]